MNIKTSRKAGFTLVEIMIVVAIIGLLAAIAIPNFINARTTSQQNACINNLRQIDGGKQQWALQFNQAASATPTTSNVQPFMGRNTGGSWPICPGAGSYTLNNVSTAPTCSLSTSPQPHQLAQ
jgi:prepilin-type N-terminal cleavage/methylation domain-containing protein